MKQQLANWLLGATLLAMMGAAIFISISTSHSGYQQQAPCGIGAFGIPVDLCDMEG